MTAQRKTPTKPVAGGYENIRGREGWATIDGKRRAVRILTHTRGNRWVVLGRYVRGERPFGPNRRTLHRRDIELIEDRLCKL